MTEPRSAEEWAEHCRDKWHDEPGLCLDCAHAFAAQERAALQQTHWDDVRLIAEKNGEIDALQQRVKDLEDLERAVWSQGLEADGETRATLTLENQRLKQRVKALEGHIKGACWGGDTA